MTFRAHSPPITSSISFASTLFNETTGGFYENRESRFQNMYIFFTPETGKTYTMTLSHEGEPPWV